VRRLAFNILSSAPTAGLGLVAATGAASYFSPKFAHWLFGPPDNLVTLLGADFVGLGLLATAKQWQVDNESKRAEARSRRHSEYADRRAAFRTWQTNAAVMMMLNYDRDVRIYEERPPVRVSWEVCEKAVIPAPYRQYLYDPELIAIRDCFNDWIENVTQLVYLEEEGLVEQRDVDNLCKPFLQRISHKTQFAHTSFARNLRLYIQWRESVRILGLFKRYGFDVTAIRERDKESLAADVASGKYGECHPSVWGSPSINLSDDS
jgi:hypothetical protein